MLSKRSQSSSDTPPDAASRKDTGPLPSQSERPPAANEIDDFPKTARLEHQAFSSMLDLTPAPAWTRKDGEWVAVPKEVDPTKKPDFDWRIELRTPLDTEQPLRLRLLGDVVLGRTSLSDVDLDIFEGADKGVSRRHALLRPTSHQLYLIELGSTNGTMLNGLPLGPGMARPLRSEDVITLGDLRLTLRLQNEPTERPNVSMVDMYVPDVLDKPERSE